MRFSENDLAICVSLLVLWRVLILLSSRFSQLQSIWRLDFELLVADHDFFVSFNVKYPNAKFNSPCDVLNNRCRNYQFSFLSNFGKVVVILSIIPATSCAAEQSFIMLQKLKTYFRSARDQECVSQVVPLRIELLRATE